MNLQTNTVSIPCTVACGAFLPVYQTAGAAGCDVCAHLAAPVTIQPMARALIPTGLSFAIPAGYEMQVRPRSGLAAKHGITVLNAPGTIDSDYRGEVKVILINLGSEAFTVQNGDRIAQLVVAPVTMGAFTACAALPATERGAGGFGSTGVGSVSAASAGNAGAGSSATASAGSTGAGSAVAASAGSTGAGSAVAASAGGAGAGSAVAASAGGAGAGSAVVASAGNAGVESASTASAAATVRA